MDRLLLLFFIGDLVSLSDRVIDDLLHDLRGDRVEDVEEVGTIKLSTLGHPVGQVPVDLWKLLVLFPKGLHIEFGKQRYFDRLDLVQSETRLLPIEYLLKVVLVEVSVGRKVVLH